MNKKNGSILLLATFGLGILIGNLLSRPAEKSVAQSEFFQDEKIRSLENQLDDANKKITALKQAARAHPSPSISPAHNSAKSETAVVAANPQPASENQKIKELETQLGKQKAKEITQWLVDGYATSRGFDPGNVMQKRFDEEPIDVAWAKEQENKLLTTLSSRPELAAFALLDTKCKSSLCQISFSVTDIEQADQIADQVSKIGSSLGKVNSIMASPNAEKKSTTVFISLVDGKLVTN